MIYCFDPTFPDLPLSYTLFRCHFFLHALDNGCCIHFDFSHTTEPFNTQTRHNTTFISYHSRRYFVRSTTRHQISHKWRLIDEGTHRTQHITHKTKLENLFRNKGCLLLLLYDSIFLLYCLRHFFYAHLHRASAVSCGRSGLAILKPNSTKKI